jgi:hypothetical protein
MTCEKLGKAFLIAGRSISPQQAKTSHVAFKRFLQVAARNPALQRLMEMSSSHFLQKFDRTAAAHAAAPANGHCGSLVPSFVLKRSAASLFVLPPKKGIGNRRESCHGHLPSGAPWRIGIVSDPRWGDSLVRP